MIKVILFDFWGTLVENGVHSPIKQVKDLLQIELPFSEYVLRMERAMMTAPWNSLKDAFEKVCEEFNLPKDSEKIEALVGLWNKSWMLARPYYEVEDMLQKLSQKYRLVLISNTDCFSIPRTLEKFNLGRFFEKIFLSYEQGLLKNDPDFFKTVFAELNVNSEECVLVGDSLESDMAAAQNSNIKGILIDRRNKREFTPKIRHLRELERVIPHD